MINLENIILSGCLDTIDHLLYDSMYMKFPEQVNPLRQKADCGCQLRGSREWEVIA